MRRGEELVVERHLPTPAHLTIFSSSKSRKHGILEIQSRFSATDCNDAPEPIRTGACVALGIRGGGGIEVGEWGGESELRWEVILFSFGVKLSDK